MGILYPEELKRESTMVETQVSILGYSILEELYNGSRTLVYRAVREDDEKPVVIKLLKNTYPNFNELLQFRNQYTISKNLNIPGIIRPYALEVYQNSYALVMEDFGGISLQEYIKAGNTTNLEDKLLIGLEIIDILHSLHQNRVIHKDIKPANILINSATKQIKLIDFSIASLLPKETQEIKNPNGLEGTLAYLSPEQTGRMNRGVDYRADFYSLGVTLYELLTGELPFKSDDVMELVHCHIAKIPPAMSKLDSNIREQEIPQVLSDIVMKLMAKNAEDRYQSAWGLKYDLEICLKQLQETGKVEYFEVGKRDISDRFIIPEKLYGRENEVQELLVAFERVAAGESALMLVTGFSGIGKTAVVNEVHKPIVKQRGYFIKGKFDQFNRSTPLDAFIQAFRNLMTQLLSEADAQFLSWKELILKALGKNGQIIIDVIPELEKIIGKQAPVPELSGTAAENRFNLIFQKFIQVFTTKEHPLVIFLDDLQWADSASLNLMRLLMGKSSNGYLFLIGAYRDNEVFPAHPLILTLEEIRKTQVIINRINLNPLSEESLNQLVAETLTCSLSVSQPLTQLIHQKTQGNPFFSTQFLKSLSEDELINFDFDKSYWQCDISQVRKVALTDDVVEFMALQLQKFPESTQHVLKLAACIGNKFDLATLAIVCEQSVAVSATDLWKALQFGLILPKNETYKFYLDSEIQNRNLEDEQIVNYKFLHDRVQQAAYSLIQDEQKQHTHLKIAQLLLHELSEIEQSERIFDLVNQYNLGQAVIERIEDKQELASLNFKAAQKAKFSVAYEAAYNYCVIGMDLLSVNAWQTDYKLIFDLHYYGSETAYLCGKFEEAEALYKKAITYARTALDQAVIYRIQMTQYQLQGRNSEAIEIQRLSLKLLGWEMPTEQQLIQANLDAEINLVSQFLEQNTIESILYLPKIENDSVAEILRILQILFYSAWLDGQPNLALLAIAKMTTLSLQYGNSDMSPFGYVGYGLIANAMLKEFSIAYQFGEMAVQLCEQFENADVRGMTNFFFAADVHSWSRPIQEADTYYEHAYQYSMEAGNWLTVGFMMMLSGSDRLTYGKNLDELYRIAITHADFLRHIKSLENLDALIIGVIQPIRNLLGLTKTPLIFDDDNFSESEYLQKYINTPYHLAWFYSVKIRHAYLFGDIAAYPNLISKLSVVENTVATHAKTPSSVFYVALMHLALIETTTEDSEHQIHWQALALLEERLNLWSIACPENILHKCLLIQAEKARLNQQKIAAIDFYEQAISQAKANKFSYEEALANELAAKFYLDWNKEKIAATYMQEAYYCYAHWGAKAKTDDLEKRYPQLLLKILQTSQNSCHINQTYVQTNETIQASVSTTTVSDALDFASILKATQALSSEIQLEELISTLLQIVIENAGAEKAALVLLNNGEFIVKAVGSKEYINQLSIPLEKSFDIPHKVINYVKNSLETIVLGNATIENNFISDEYVVQQQPKSLLCAPILDRGKLIGLLYLENKFTVDVFTSERLEVINLLCNQTAISLENARLYQQSQSYGKQLEQSLNNLQQAQQKLLENDKNMQMQVQALFEVSQSQAISFGDLQTAFQELTEKTAFTLQIERVSVWLFDDEHTKIRCVDLFEKTSGLHSQGLELCVVDYPNYFAAIHAEARLAVDDAQNDLKTCEFRDHYLIPLNIFSMLDSSVHLDGEVGGLVCCEQVGSQRIWTKAEQNFVRSIANLITLTIESNKKHQKAAKLEQIFSELKQAQLQMVQNEKMATLGNLVAGVAHEVNNPIGFLKGSISNAEEYIKDLFAHLECYQESYPTPEEEVNEHAEDIDLEFLSEDLPKLLNSMRLATERIKDISTSLRTFSRADTTQKVACNLHEGIDSTILILKYRLKANDKRPAIKVIQEYAKLPLVKCFLGQLNQVFMNIIANAIDALDTVVEGKTFTEIDENSLKITISTEIKSDGDTVLISIKDNASGMPESVREHVFDNLFTTKGVGKGTGLGLAIAKQIVEETHNGKLDCHSTLGEGTEFIIELPVKS